MKFRLTKINQTLSLRISLLVVFAVSMLMLTALFVMFYYARRAVKNEALRKAEQSLTSIVQKTDNVLLCVEQMAGNAFFDLLFYLDQPEKMPLYTRALVEASPFVAGCAIAFEPGYFQGYPSDFIVFHHRQDSYLQDGSNMPVVAIKPSSKIPYTEQEWYAKPFKSGRPCWTNPFKDKDAHDEDVIKFGIPIHDPKLQRVVGVLAVGVALKTLSTIVLEAKPSAHSYATMLSNDGSFLVHPDSVKLFHQNVFTQTTQKEIDPSVRKAAQAMVSGQTGYKEFTLNGQECFVFYRPFKSVATPLRVVEDLGWSVGIIYPEDDIFGDYNDLHLYTLVIALVGLLLLLAFCYWYIHRQLQPLQTLTQSALRISQGHYKDPIPDSRQQDEVGQLQDHFQQMQKSLAVHMRQLEDLTEQMQQQGKSLKTAYEKAKEADRMKTAFLHNVSDQMITPVESIKADVTSLCDKSTNLSPEEAGQLVSNIQEQGKTVTVLLNDLLTISDQEVK